LKALLPCLVVLEGSGGYEGMVAATLVEASLPVAIVNPRQVRKLAGAIGRLVKTDAIDAAVIAHFAQAVRPAARPLPDDLAIRPAELMARRRIDIGRKSRFTPLTPYPVQSGPPTGQAITHIPHLALDKYIIEDFVTQ
jgi:transposase